LLRRRAGCGAGWSRFTQLISLACLIQLRNAEILPNVDGSLSCSGISKAVSSDNEPNTSWCPINTIRFFF
jgi:hypothetical protein